MGKSLLPTNNFARIISLETLNTSKQTKPIFCNRVFGSKKQELEIPRKELPQLGLKMEGGDSVSDSVSRTRVPLGEVVKDCVKRWFEETLKEAKNGDTNMQVLVGQMYNSGYGVTKNTEKGHTWINRASKSRSSAWKVSNRQPGHNGSDSESQDVKDTKIPP